MFSKWAKQPRREKTDQSRGNKPFLEKHSIQQQKTGDGKNGLALQ